MIIRCNRCGREISSPDDMNADYVIASDFIVRERRTRYRVLTHTEDTLIKEQNGETISDEEYNSTEVDGFEQAGWVANVAKVVPFEEEVDVQKSGIVCPDCYLKTDFIIWGVHK